MSTGLLGRAESLLLPVGTLGGGFAQNTLTFHCRCPSFLLPQQDSCRVSLPLSPALCPHPSWLSTRQRAGRAASHVDNRLIFSSLLSSLTVYAQELSGSDNHLEEANSRAFGKCRKSAFKFMGREGLGSLLRRDPEGPQAGQYAAVLLGGNSQTPPPHLSQAQQPGLAQKDLFDLCVFRSLSFNFLLLCKHGAWHRSPATVARLSERCAALGRQVAHRCASYPGKPLWGDLGSKCWGTGDTSSTVMLVPARGLHQPPP